MNFRHLLPLLAAILANTEITSAQDVQQFWPALQQAQSQQAAAPRQVVINDVRLSNEQVTYLEKATGSRIQSGDYWYDSLCGTWGFKGGAAAGVIPAGLKLGGKLKADASGGNTGVFVNGRELHAVDVLGLQRLFGTVAKGRYWLNAQGIGGIEGRPASFSLRAAAARQNTFHRNSNLGTGSGYSNGTGYVMGKGWSVIYDD